MSPKHKLSTLAFALLGLPMFAQGPPPPPPPPPIGLVVPIDENLMTLFLVGFFFGVYAVIQLKKKKKVLS